jgi:hypothetical protein
MPRERDLEVEVIHDVNDDKAVQDGIRERCAADPHCLLISLGPRGGSTDSLARHVLAALGVDPVPWPVQLTFSGLDAPAPSPPRQLTLPFTPPPHRWGWADGWRRRRGLRSLDDAIVDATAARITDLYVLRAHAVRSSAWVSLGWFARACEVRVHFVVHSRGDVSEHVRDISRCAVVSETVMAPTPVTPWWRRPPFKRRITGDAPLVARGQTEPSAA